jgi:hypothetical protein
MPSSQAVSLPGTVHAFGSEAARAGEIYAGLTGRPHKLSGQLSDVAAESHDVVVCLTEHLTAQLMRKLYLTENPRGAPGFITAPTPMELEEVCIRQAAKLTDPQKTTVQRVFFSPALSFDIIRRGSDIISGGACTSSQLFSRLSSDSALLLVGGHSNSFDMRLSLQHWLCAFLDKPSTGTGPLPECQLLGRCVRFPARPTVTEARGKGWLLPVSTLRAKVALFYGCSVVKLRDGLHSPDYGLGPALLGRSESAAIITTWRPEHPPAEWGILNNLINDVCSGTMVGEAVGSFNRSNIATQFGINLCLLGDPCFRISSEGRFAKLPVPKIPYGEAAPAGTVKNRSAEANLLRAAIKQTLHNNPLFDSGTALEAQLLAYCGPEPEAEDLGQRAQMAEADKDLLHFLSPKPVLNEFLLSFGEIREMTEKGVCPACLGPARSYCIAFPNFGAASRSVVLCECCGGETLNLPSSWRTRLDLDRLDDGIFSLSNLPPEAQILVFVVVAARGSQWFVGLFPHSGEASRAFQLPDQLPPAPLFCQVLIASGLKIGSLGFKLSLAGAKHGIQSWHELTGETVPAAKQQ